MLIVVSLIVFFILETFVRYLYGPGRIQDSEGNVPYVDDSELGYKLKPKFDGGFKEIDFNTRFATNSQGFRNEFDFNNEDKNVILMVGDSFTAGSGVEVNENIASNLQKIIGGNYKIYNIGVPGYSEIQFGTQLKRMLPVYDTKLIILNIYTGNDVSDNCGGFLSTNEDKTFYDMIKHPLKRSQFIVLLYRKIVVPFKYPRNIDYYMDFENVRKCYTLTEKHLKEIKEIAQDYDVPLLVTLIPREQQTVENKRKELIEWYDNFDEYDYKTFDLNIIHKKVMGMCNNLDMECLDFMPVFVQNQEKDLYLNDGHWNSNGHELAAMELEKFIKYNYYLK